MSLVRTALCEGCQGSGVADSDDERDCEACPECDGCGYYDCPCSAGPCHREVCDCMDGDW